MGNEQICFLTVFKEARRNQEVLML
jgi:hypothetical protein